MVEEACCRANGKFQAATEASRMAEMASITARPHPWFAKCSFSIGMSPYDLTGFEWRVIEPLLPNTPRGVPRVDDRRVRNGILACRQCPRQGPTRLNGALAPSL